MAETSIRLVTNSECKMKGNGYCPRPLEKTTFLSKKWALSIIVTIGNFGTLRFNDLLNRIGGITQKTLTERLRELERHNLLVRKSFPEKPPRVEYTLTRNGQKVRQAVLPIIELADSDAFSKSAD